MSTYPHAQALIDGSSESPNSTSELDEVARTYAHSLGQILGAVADKRLAEILPLLVQEEVKRQPAKVVYVTDPTSLMASGRMVTSKSNRIAMFIGAMLGLIAGIVLVNYLDPGVFRVDSAAASYQAVLSTIVDQTWFEVTALVLCTGLGWAIGSLFGPRATLRLQVWATGPDGKLHTVKTVRAEDITNAQA